MNIIDATNTYGVDAARMMAAARAAADRAAYREEHGRDIGEDDIGDMPGPLSGEYAGDPTPLSLMTDILGDDYLLHALDADTCDYVYSMLADAYDGVYFDVLIGEATACGPLTLINAICESPGTYCAHDMTR